jgi:methionyl-tRNA formyltransferase
MKIIFMGSAEFACPALNALVKAGRDEIIAVVSQPERPSGRHQAIKRSPLAELAVQHGLHVIMPENVNIPQAVEQLRALHPDLIIVAAYGQILKPELLNIPPKGCINVHASLLPKFRGAAPIQWAIARGEKTTGVTTMFMNEKMDAGDIICRAEENILSNDTSASLSGRLSEKGAKLLLEAIEMIRKGTAPRIKQDEALATYAPLLKKSDGLLDWTKPAEELENRIRAFQPWPVCFFTLNNKNIRVLGARVEADGGKSAGIILEAAGEGLKIQCGSGSLRLLKLQPEGKKPMSGYAFLCGYKMAAGNSNS